MSVTESKVQFGCLPFCLPKVGNCYPTLQLLDHCADHARLGCLKDAEDRDDGLIGLWWFVVSAFGRKLFAVYVPSCSKHENRNKHDDLKVSFTCIKQGSHR